jgi:hypothetical protein
VDLTPPWSSQRPRDPLVLPIFICQGWPQAMSHFQQSRGYCHASLHLRRSPSTVEGQVMRRNPGRVRSGLWSLNVPGSAGGRAYWRDSEAALLGLTRLA